MFTGQVSLEKTHVANYRQDVMFFVKSGQLLLSSTGTKINIITCHCPTRRVDNTSVECALLVRISYILYWDSLKE